MAALYDRDYDRYATLVIKEAVALHRQLALRIHPDKQEQSSLTAALKPRCGPAMTVLNNALDAVKEAFSRHLVPAITGLQAYFSLDDDSPAIVLRWDCNPDLEMEIAIAADDEGGVLDIWRVDGEVGLQTLAFDDFPFLFEMEQLEFTAAHIGVFGPQADFRGAESRLVLPTTEEVFECVENRQRCKQLEEEVRKLRSTIKERRDRGGPIGAKPEAPSHKRAWECWGDYVNNHNYGKKQRWSNIYTDGAAPPPPWRRSSASSWKPKSKSPWKTAWKKWR
jgi:hypothetical protein